VRKPTAIPFAALAARRDQLPIPGRPEDDQKPSDPRVFNPQYRARLFALIDGAPFVRHMGMRIADLAWGGATFEMAPAEFRLQPFGVVHGGNIATLIDTATFWACFLSMDSDDDGLASVDLKLNYLAPARMEALRCTGTLIKAGKTLSYAEAEVRAGDGRLLAHGTSTLMRLPGLGVKLGIPLWAA
jgi:uncharacterized protein (TIGR00369 family)